MTTDRYQKVQSEHYDQQTMLPKWDNSTPIELRNYEQAPKQNGVYVIGHNHGGKFVAMYLGRAAGPTSTLYTRLRKHFLNSHNEHVRKNVKQLCFHFMVLTISEAKAVEALEIAAMTYMWNDREEWKQHSALMD